MSKQFDKKNVFKTAFLILLIPDLISLVLLGISMVSTFQTLAGYGHIMLTVAGTIVAVAVVSCLFEILAKAFLARNPFSGRKHAVVFAKILFLLNLCAVIIHLLSGGGEGETLKSQINLYWQILSSVAEMVVVIAYLRALKKCSDEN